MKVSTAGRDLIASFEGLSLAAYLCPAGVATIGYGHTKGVKMGARLASKVYANILLDEDLESYAAEVEKSLAATLVSQHEFDAMCSLAFNVGVTGFSSSSVLRQHKAGNKEGAARAFMMWDKATIGGVLQSVSGLTRRRAAEAGLYLTPVVAVRLDMPQAVASPVPLVSSKSVIAGGVATAAGAASVADQISQIMPTLQAVAAVGLSLQSILKLGAITLSVVALAAGAYMLYRYIQKHNHGEVVST